MDGVEVRENENAEAIDTLATRKAHRHDVGKTTGGQGKSQETINRLLVHYARRGRHVVRLKGGDPFVFGRGGEEAEWLVRHGIRFEVIPGITAALACAAYAGIPLTHRAHANSLHFVTAHGAASVDRIDWRALARPRQTLVVYMGVAAAGVVGDRLLAARLPPATPVAIVEKGSLPGQRVVVTDLAGLAKAIGVHDIRSPALLIIGEVASLGAQLAWFGALPVVEALRKSA